MTMPGDGLHIRSRLLLVLLMTAVALGVAGSARALAMVGENAAGTWDRT